MIAAFYLLTLVGLIGSYDVLYWHWYKLRLFWPPIRTNGGLVKNWRAPGMRASLGRNSSMTCSGVKFLSERGVSVILSMPLFCDPLTNTFAPAMFESWRRTSAAWRCIASISS